MRFSNPALTRLALGGFYLLGRHRLASAQTNLPGCIDSTVVYTRDEADRENVTTFSEYVFCPGSTITVGGESILPDVAEPPILVFNPKIRFKCGESGERSEMCVIKGQSEPSDFARTFATVTFTYYDRTGIAEEWPRDADLPPSRPDHDPVDIEFHGITFDGGLMFASSDVPASVTFKDCAFINGASPFTGFDLTNYMDEEPTEEPTEGPTSGPTESPETEVPTMMPIRPTMMPIMMPGNDTSVPTSAPAVPTEAPGTTGMPTFTSMPTGSPVTGSPTSTMMPVAPPTYAPIKDNECNPITECKNPEFPCCSRFGFCGNQDAHCSPDNCVSGCPNATAPSPGTTDAPTAMPAADVTPPNGTTPTAMPVAATPNGTDTDAPTAMPVMTPADNSTNGNTTDPTRRLLGRPRRRPRASSVLAAARSVAGRRRRAQGDAARAKFVFEMCHFTDNEVANEGGIVALMFCNGAHVAFKMCTFDGNAFVDGAGANGPMVLTALLAGIDTKLEISESCVTNTDEVTSLFAIFKGPDDDATPTTNMNHGSDNNFNPGPNLPECEGISVYQGDDPDDSSTWNAECLVFEEDTCALDEAETKDPTSVPTSKPTKEGETEEPTQATTVSMEPTPEPTFPPSAAVESRVSSAVAAVVLVSALFVALA